MPSSNAALMMKDAMPPRSFNANNNCQEAMEIGEAANTCIGRCLQSYSMLPVGFNVMIATGGGAPQGVQ